MPKEKTVFERRERFSQIWSMSRAKAGKTQEFMAKGLGVSKKTIQNWENGVTAPDLFNGSEWFRVLGMNPLPYYLSYLFPDLFNRITPDEDDRVIEETLIELIRDSTVAEKRQLLYLMAGSHGSPWYTILQMFTAHCHTTMRDRVVVARSIVDNYEMDAAMSTLVCPDQVQPDLTMLRQAIEEAKQSVCAGTQGYTIAYSEFDPKAPSTQTDR